MPPKKPPGTRADDVPLPAGLDVLWGLRERATRGPKPALTVDAIVDAAMHVADTEGLDAVSMARVARDLGFTTMSLYRYITSKDELLQLMWNASARGAENLRLKGAGWRPKLRMWAQIQREMLDRHRWITQLPMAAPPMAPNSLTFVELGLAALDATPLPDADKLRVIGLLSSYTLSEARMAHDAARAAAQAMASGGSARGSAAWDFEALLRRLTDEQHYPRLHRIAWSADIGSAPSGFDERQEFLFGVERILDGVQAFIDRAKPARKARPARPARRQPGQ